MTLAEPSIEQLLTETRSRPTPFYLLDETRLLRNLRRITRLRERSGAKAVLALKCFSTWSVFPLMREHLDGTTSSSLFEARLGHETFGKETHAYSVAFSDADIEAVRGFATKVIFNSTSQLLRYHDRVKHLPVGLRINPGVSHSHFDLADPARPRCRLGATSAADIDAVADRLSGVMFHCQCENDDFEKFKFLLDRIAADYGPLLKRLDWVSLGGGIYFTKEGYPLDDLAEALRDFAARFDVQVYLEPGEAAITRTAYLVTSVLDLVRNEVDIAVVDSAVEPHMLDLLIYRTDAKMDLPSGGRFPYTVAGKTCLAGDVFGTFPCPAPLAVGDRVAFADAAGYTMVKKNWFNGVAMPSIVVRRLDGRLDAVRDFTYDDYRSQLS